MTETSKSKFNLGQVVATPGAIEALAAAEQDAVQFLQRHSRGDWGVVCDEDAGLNDESLLDGSRLLSAYILSTGVKVWIITEAVDDEDRRAATTLLLPEEY